MCGIVGYVGSGSRRSLERPLNKALEALAPRGPDDSGIHLEQAGACAVALGHRRLSIRDLSQDARQPLPGANGAIQLICNGEIYNAAELRTELESQGHRFRSRSDNEVIVHGFAQWGEQVLSRLDGMFALALWDKRSRRLHLARDRMGIKPLLFARLQGGIVFASELRVLSDWPGVDRRVDIHALHQYLTFGYTLTPRTLLTSIAKLEPGHILTYDAGRDRVEKECYWNLEDAFRSGTHDAFHGRNGDSAESQLWSRLGDAVEARRAADVPLGSFLSGGVDSTTISALMSAQAPRSTTFCTDFEQQAFSEAREASRTAQSLNLRHEAHILVPPRADEMPALVRAADEPTGDSSFVPYHRLSAFARQHVTVALSGDGADEMLAGYVTYAADQHHRYLRALPQPARHWLATSVAPAIKPAAGTKLGVAYKASHFLRAADVSPARAHAQWRCLWHPSEVGELVTPELAQALTACSSDPLGDVERRFESVADLPFLQQALYVDLSTWLVDDILHKVDRASMASGLEVRVPFLDHRLVEWCARLPVNLKRRGGTGKWILRRALRRHCPGIRFQRRKQGFNAPVGSWINGSLASWADDLIHEADRWCGDWLSPGGFHVQCLREHRAGRADHGYKLWSLLWLIEWFRQTGATL